MSYPKKCIDELDRQESKRGPVTCKADMRQLEARIANGPLLRAVSWSNQSQGN
jgi:hypothetical protein